MYIQCSQRPDLSDTLVPELRALAVLAEYPRWFTAMPESSPHVVALKLQLLVLAHEPYLQPSKILILLFL